MYIWEYGHTHSCIPVDDLAARAEEEGTKGSGIWRRFLINVSINSVIDEY